MKTLIIPCGGQSLRMKEYYFPKCLLPVHQRPILFEIINYWRNYIDEVVIVLNRNSGEMIKKYIETYFDDSITIKYCYQERKSGTYFAIKKAVQVAKNKEYILNWSDILLTKPLSEITENSVFVTEKVPCRWKFDKSFENMGACQISSSGIFGIFVLKELPCKFYEVEDELESEVEILEKLNSQLLKPFEFEDFIDIGDLKKYDLSLRISNKVRAFGSSNELTFTDEEVIKKTKNNKLSRCEQNWYKNATFDFVPKVRGYNPLRLERINPSETLANYLTNNPNEEVWVIKKVFEILTKIHLSKGSVDWNNKDSFEQYYKKTIERLEKVEFLFSDFKNKIIINGKEYQNPKELLIENKEKIESIFAKEFRFIHGDLQLSNLLIDDNKKLYVIDPRGYFGDSMLYGDPMYDFAKLYYGFCGLWNQFSKGYGEVKFVDGEFFIKPLIDKKTLEKRRSLFFSEAENLDYLDISKFKIDLLHAIIWLSVPDYISNDVLSALYGYLNGTILINKLFSK